MAAVSHSILLSGDVDLLLQYWERKLVKKLLKEKELFSGSFELDNIKEEDVPVLFRFQREDIRRLHHVLGLPEEIINAHCPRVSGVSPLCILLRRLSYPSRLQELEPLFQMHFTSISGIAIFICKFVYGEWVFLLRSLRANAWLFQDSRLEKLANIVQRRGAPLKNCIGFIDGTARAIARPSLDRRNYHSGHKRTHCLKFQAVALPNGAVVSLSDPYVGKSHDAGILRQTGFLEDFGQSCPGFCVYGDQGYPKTDCLVTPFHRTQNLTEAKIIFNRDMASVHQCVEWAFGKVATLFAFTDFKKNQKILKQEVSELYTTAVLLANAHTSLYGSVINSYFGSAAVTLEIYFRK